MVLRVKWFWTWGYLTILALAGILWAGCLAQRSSSDATFSLEAEEGEKPSEKTPVKLTLKTPQERTLKAGDVHIYQIAVSENQFLHVVVAQNGIEVKLTLRGPDGTELMKVNHPSGLKSSKEVLTICQGKGGNDTIEVQALAKDSASGAYTITIETLRPAQEDDFKRVMASQRFTEGIRIHLEQKTEEGYALAIQKFEEALTLTRQLKDRLGEGEVLSEQGSVYIAVGQIEKALELLSLAQTIFQSEKDRSGEAKALKRIGMAYYYTGENQKAVDFYNQAVDLFQKNGLLSELASTLSDLGVAYFVMGDNKKALDFYNQAILYARQAKDLEREINTLNNIGTLHLALSEYEKAFECYEKTLPYYESTNDIEGQAYVFFNKGWIHTLWGENAKALAHYERSLNLFRSQANKRGAADVLNNLGLVYMAIGEQQKALECYNEGLKLYRDMKDQKGEAYILHGIGMFYARIGEFEQALSYFEQALPLRRATGDRRGEASTLGSIGGVYGDLDEYEKSLAYHQQTLELRRIVQDRSGEAITLYNIGTILYEQNQYSEAADYYLQALPIFQSVGNRFGEAFVIHNMGKLYMVWDDEKNAQASYEKALGLRKAIADASGEADTLYALAQLKANQGHLEEAKADMETALTIIESLRSKIANPEHRASYFSTVQSYFKFYIDLMMQMHRKDPAKGFDAAAFYTSERSKARSLLEILTESHMDIRQGVNPELLTQWRSLQNELNAKATYQERLFQNRAEEAKKEAVKKEIEVLTEKRQSLEAQIRSESPRYAELVQPKLLNRDEIQNHLLDDETMLLSFSLGEKRSFLWALTRSEMTSFELPAQADVENLSKDVYRLLTARNTWTSIETTSQRKKRISQSDADYFKAVDHLSDMLMGSVAPKLKKIKRLFVVAEGTLQYIPFAALPMPKGAKSLSAHSDAFMPLGVEFEIVTLPSASTLAAIRQDVEKRSPAQNDVIVLADPVFSNDDQRIRQKSQETSATLEDLASGDEKSRLLIHDIEQSASESGIAISEFRIPRIPFTRQEAEGIVSLVPEGKGKLVLDFSANRSFAIGEELRRYQMVHFATHGFLNNLHPDLSGLVLSLVDETGALQDGFLRLHDIYNLNLPVELVVLSACQTGLGKEVNGEGLIGLTRGFMYAGAKRVVVSLWSVSDEATSVLMRHFYEGILGSQKLRPAAALKAAQAAMWQDKRWKSPYYWAAFVLQGEWN